MSVTSDSVQFNSLNVYFHCTAGEPRGFAREHSQIFMCKSYGELNTSVMNVGSFIILDDSKK